MLQRLKNREFDLVYPIMEVSFPVNERRTYEEQKALLKNAAYAIYVLKDGENDAVKGFMALWELERLVFLEHFAVAPGCRNGGLGAKMLAQAQRLLQKPFCLEVELPETALAARRIAFYERNGFFLNDFPYIQPPLSNGRDPVPLRVMTSGRAVSREEFERIKALLYTRVYGQPASRTDEK